MVKQAVISIVDDDESVREATMNLMKSLGLDSEAFQSAEEFLHSDRCARTSCLIADVQMPGMTGLELHSHLVGLGQPHSDGPDHSLRRREHAAERSQGRSRFAISPSRSTKWI